MKNLIIVFSFFVTFSLHAQQSFQCPPGTSQAQERVSKSRIIKFCHDEQGEKLGPFWQFQAREGQDSEPLVINKRAVVPKPDGSRDNEMLAHYEYSGEHRAPTKEIHYMKDTVIIKRNKYKINSDLSVEVESKCVSRPRDHYKYENHVRAEHRRAMKRYAAKQGGGLANPQTGMGGFGNSMTSYHYYPGGYRIPSSVAIENFNNIAQSTSSFSSSGSQKEVDCINADVLAEGYGDHVFQGQRGAKPENRDSTVETDSSVNSSASER